ncbi:MAG: hypothetical protein N2Z20_01445 [Elusimicrobiales bacterium]|nr:hypothetical protein [Elusimicrobiales bacterium]
MIRYSECSFKPDDYTSDHELNINLLIQNNIDFFYKNLFYTFLPSLLLGVIVLLIKKEFGFLFIYGVFFSFAFSFIDITLSLYISKIMYPYILSKSYDRIRDIFLVIKFLLVTIINVLFYNLYLKKGINYDYPIVIMASICVSYFFYIVAYNKYKKLISFVSHSNILFLMISIILFSFKYLNSYEVNVILYSWLSFVLCIIVNEFLNRFFLIKLSRKNFVLINLFFIIVYPLAMVFIIYKMYANLFIFLTFYIVYLILFFIFKRNEVFEKYHLFVCFFMIILFFFLSRIFYVFITTMNYEKFNVFILMLLLPLFYYSLVEREYIKLLNFNSNISLFEKTEPDMISLKKTFILIVLVCGLGFKIAYDYINVYYGNVDSYNFFSLITPIFFFYILESYSDIIIKKIENLILNIIFNTSIVFFLFSTSIVICSYTFSLNYINLVSMFYLYSFLTLLLSSKYLSYIISMMYLTFIYMIIYV